MAPLSLTQLLSQKNVPMQLRCNGRHLLEVSWTSLKYEGDMSFQNIVPMLYKVLPVNINSQGKTVLRLFGGKMS